MAPVDIEKIRSGKEQLVRTLERNRAAIDVAGKEIAKTLATSGSEAESARSDLRKIGYLKK